MAIVPPMAEPEALQRLGDYWVVAPLGHGGMARVDLAMKEGDDDIVVLKQLLAGLEDDDETARRFLREATIASALDHPNIARVLDVFEEAQRVCLAMEFVPGITFEELNKRCWKEGPPCPPAVAVSLVKQLLEALEYAHDFFFEGRPAGIVHRDLSTKNLLIAFNGRVKVIDFGVAKGEVDDLRTATGMLMGTPLYMSPEQAKGLRVDRRSDLYTAGVVLWEMLAGRRLVQAKGRAAMLHAVAAHDAPPLSEIAEVPAAFDAVLARALAKDPEDRFATAGEFLTALVPAAAGVGLMSPPELAEFVVARLPDREAEIADTIRSARAASPAHKRTVARIQLAASGKLPPPTAEARLLDAAPAESTHASFASTPIEAPRRAGPMWAVLGALLVLGGIFGFQSLGEAPSVDPVPAAARGPSVTPRVAESPAEGESSRAVPVGQPSTVAIEPEETSDSAAAGDVEAAAAVGSESDSAAGPEPEPEPEPAPTQAKTDPTASDPVPAEPEDPTAPVGTLLDPDEDAPPPAPSPTRRRMKQELQRYVQSAAPDLAAKMVVDLKREAARGSVRRQRCMDPVLDDLLRADYHEVEDVRPLFLEAIECL